MRKDPEDIELRSEEVQEILGTPPGWMASWGTTLVFITFVALAWAGYWIKYPDIVDGGKVEISTTNPPATLFSKKAGMVIEDVLVENDDNVKVGRLLLVFKSSDGASYPDVLSLYDILFYPGSSPEDSVVINLNLPKDLNLGDGALADAFNDFVKSQINYEVTIQPNQRSSNEVERMIANARENIREQERVRNKLAKEMDAANAELRRRRRLYEQSKIPFPVLNNAENKYIMLEREMATVLSKIKEFDFFIDALRRSTRNSRQSFKQSTLEARKEVLGNYRLLQKEVENWCDQYLLTTPAAGRVIYSKKSLRPGMEITTPNAPIIYIAPLESSETVATGYLKLDGSGKVKADQKVIVKLESYPFEQFGALIGKIKYRERTPVEQIFDGKKEESFYYEISFPNGLTTSAGKTLEGSPKLTGNAEIITENRSLIDWIIQAIKGRTFVAN